MSGTYTPLQAPPSTPAETARWALDELARVAAALALVQEFDPLHTAPLKPRRGLVVYADGTDWDPGSGEGLYRYNGTVWVFVG